MGEGSGKVKDAIGNEKEPLNLEPLNRRTLNAGVRV
jgi:hypothetical protein